MPRHERRDWKLRIVAGAILLGLASAGPVLAQQSQQQAGPPAPPPRGHTLFTPEDRAAMGQIFWHRTQERLGLTDQQAAEIRAVFETQRAAARADRQGLMAARRQLQSLIDQPTVDAAAVQAVAGKVKELQAKLLDHRLQTQLSLRAKLTPEQWQTWRALRQDMGNRGRHHRGGHGPERM